MEKKYVFFRSEKGGESIRREVPESELTEVEKKLLLGELLHTWENTPLEQKLEFLQTINEDEAGEEEVEDNS